MAAQGRGRERAGEGGKSACASLRVRVRVSKLDEIEGENYVTQRDVIRELSS